MKTLDNLKKAVAGLNLAGSTSLAKANEGAFNENHLLDIIRTHEQKGTSLNYLPLFHVRNQVPQHVPREDVDKMLRSLRDQGKLNLSSLQEGRHYTKEQIDAGIPMKSEKAGGPLFFASLPEFENKYRYGIPNNHPLNPKNMKTEKPVPNPDEVQKSTPHLQNLHKAFLSKPPPKPPWVQPKMTPKQERDYKSVRAALINLNTPVETLAQITDRYHPVFPFLTSTDHANAYRNAYKQHANMPDTDPLKDEIEQNYLAHKEQIQHKG
jgi:hypothetical protein